MIDTWIEGRETCLFRRRRPSDQTVGRHPDRQVMLRLGVSGAPRILLEALGRRDQEEGKAG